MTTHSRTKNLSQNAGRVIVIVKCLKWTFAFFVISMFIGMALSWGLPEQLMKMNASQLKQMTVDLAPGLRVEMSALREQSRIQGDVNMRLFFASLALGIAVTCAVLFLITRSIQAILINAQKGSPFDSENGKHLRLVSICIGIFSLIKPALSMLIYGQIIDTFDLEGYRILYRIDWFLLIIAMLIALLSQIFKYGAFLQTEFDETL